MNSTPALRKGPAAALPISPTHQGRPAAGTAAAIKQTSGPPLGLPESSAAGAIAANKRQMRPPRTTTHWPPSTKICGSAAEHMRAATTMAVRGCAPLPHLVSTANINAVPCAPPTRPTTRLLPTRVAPGARILYLCASVRCLDRDDSDCIITGIGLSELILGFLCDDDVVHHIRQTPLG